MRLDLCVSHSEKLSILEDIGKKTKNNKWFVVTDDGQCHLFDNACKFDDISKITELSESCIRKDITRIHIPNSVTSIGNWAFYGCGGLTSIIIPNSVTSIKNEAFTSCRGLTSVIIPDSVVSIKGYAFCGCSGLTSVTIGNNVRSLGSYVFYSCSVLTSVTIPDSVRSVGDYAFYNCSSLTSIAFKGKALEQVKAMNSYPWGIKDTSIIHIE